MASVAALTFLAARAVPLGWVVGVAGGVPLARAAQRYGGRAGYAAATASLVETMAIMGPARMGIPVPHAVSAPWLGVLQRRGRSLFTLALAGAGVRTGYYVATSAFSILVLTGLDAYVGSYEQLRQRLGFLPEGEAAALWLTVVMLVVWSLGAGLVQAWVLRRGLRDRSHLRQPHPRAGLLVAVAMVGFAVTLSGTDTWSPDRIRPIWAKCSASKTAPFLGGRTHVDDLVQSWASACQPTTWGGGCRWGMGSGEAALPRGEGGLHPLLISWPCETPLAVLTQIRV